MKNIGRIFQFEAKKLWYNKLLMLLLAGVLIAIFVVTHSVYSAYPATPKYPDKYSKKLTLEKYARDIEWNLERMEKPETPEYEKEDLRLKNKRLEFFISSDKTEYDYLDASDTGIKKESLENAGYAFFFMNICYFILVGFAVLVSLQVFAFDYTNTRIKNTVASPSERKTVFAGKALFLLSVLTAACAIFFVYAAGFMLSVGESLFLCYFGGEYYAISGIVLLLAEATGLFVLMLATAAITAAVAVFWKSPTVASAAVGILYFFVLVLFFLIQKQFEIDGNLDGVADVLKWLPVLGIQQFWQYGFTLTYAIILIAHTAAAVCAYFSAKVKFVRQDL